MIKQIWYSICISYMELPIWVQEGLLVALCIGGVALLSFYGVKKGIKLTLRLLLFEYVVLIFCSTFFFRPTMKERIYDFHPFWSYVAIQEGRKHLLKENIMNVVMFVPIGLLLECGIRVMTWREVLLIGAGVSLIIEILQLVFMRGFSEFDDVIHNTLGCMIGLGIYNLMVLSRKLFVRI